MNQDRMSFICMMDYYGCMCGTANLNCNCVFLVRILFHYVSHYENITVWYIYYIVLTFCVFLK
jgi:hypothetical protein